MSVVLYADQFMIRLALKLQGSSHSSLVLIPNNFLIPNKFFLISDILMNCFSSCYPLSTNIVSLRFCFI